LPFISVLEEIEYDEKREKTNNQSQAVTIIPTKPVAGPAQKQL
jgi:hypothetical protein